MLKQMEKDTFMCCLQTYVNEQNIGGWSSDFSKWNENIHVSSSGLSKWKNASMYCLKT
jgi:hypothetical protein